MSDILIKTDIKIIPDNEQFIIDYLQKNNLKDIKLKDIFSSYIEDNFFYKYLNNETLDKINYSAEFFIVFLFKYFYNQDIIDHFSIDSSTQQSSKISLLLRFDSSSNKNKWLNLLPKNFIRAKKLKRILI